MKTPKSLLQLAEPFGGTVEILTFRDGRNDTYHTGFAVVDKDGNELLTCEPVWYSNGDRWHVHNKCSRRLTYVKTLRGLKADIKPGNTGFRFKRKPGAIAAICLLLALVLGACSSAYHCPTYKPAPRPYHFNR
jgi:hypothetical protein